MIDCWFTRKLGMVSVIDFYGGCEFVYFRGLHPFNWFFFVGGFVGALFASFTREEPLCVVVDDFFDDWVWW